MMKRFLSLVAVAAATVVWTSGEVRARGYGGARGGYAAGGYRAGGVEAGGYRAGGYEAGGYRAGGYEAGGYRAGGVEAGGVRAGGYGAGGYRAGGVEAGGVRVGGVEAGGVRAGGVEAGGVRAGGVRAGGVEAGGVRAGGVEAGGVRAGGVEAGGVRAGGAHVGLPTDFAGSRYVGSVRAGGYVAAGHSTYGVSASTYAARGVAVRNNFYHYDAFRGNWWGAHPYAWRPYGWGPAYGWRWATWPGLYGWFGWGAVAPVYYDYGNTIVYQDDQVYSNGQPIATADQYYQQALTLAQTAPPLPPPPAGGQPAAAPTAQPTKEDEWQPLGVFALVQGDQSDTSTIFQLAVNHAGIIRGNYYNALTETSLTVRGAVDAKTQRASWIVGENKDTVYDTGIANLTKEESPILVHFGKDRTQQWTLVRLEDKDPKNAPAPQGNAVPPPQPVAADGQATARVDVVVPADAALWFDGVLATKTGTERPFVTPPLEPGRRFAYQVKARWTDNGLPVEQTRQVIVQAGSRVRVDFTSPAP